jgi:hypothetical protein
VDVAVWLLTITLAFQQDVPKTAPTQPIPYSHKMHLALGLQCRECHTNPEPGDRMEFPPTDKCMECHSDLAKLAELTKGGRPIPWVRVYVLPAGVYWNHRSHLDAKVSCERCHGAVAQMDVMANVTNVTTMAGCVECHKQMKAGTGCGFCHEGK